MLVALYDAALDGLSAYQQATAAGEKIGATQARLRTARVLAGIRAGIDLAQGELPRQIDRLCEFAQHALFSEETARIAAAARVLGRLRESFAAIEREASKLEARGEIPPLSAEICRQVLA